MNNPETGPPLLVDTLSKCTLEDVGGNEAVEAYNTLKQNAGFTA